MRQSKLKAAALLGFPLIFMACSSGNEMVNNYYEDGIYFDESFNGSLTASSSSSEYNTPGYNPLGESSQDFDYYDPQDNQTSAPISSASSDELQWGDGTTGEIGSVVASASAVLPPIRLAGVGGEKGVTPAELGLVVAGAISGEMLKEMIARELIQRAGDIKQALSAENLMAALKHAIELSPDMEMKIIPKPNNSKKSFIMN